MRRAAIAYGDGELEVSAHDDLWTVRLRRLEARARYLDVAIAELLGDAPGVHRAAARLVTELANAAGQLEDVELRTRAPQPRRERRGNGRQRVWAKPLVLGFRVLVFAAVVSTAFMLTTWLITLR